MPSAGVSQLPGLPVFDVSFFGAEVEDFQVADFVFVEERGEVDVALAALLWWEGCVLEQLAVLGEFEMVCL